MLVDTHAHLYWDLYKDDLDEVIERSLSADVTTIINVGVDPKLSKVAAEQVKNQLSKIPNLRVFSTIGIHPHEATKYSSVVSIHEDIKKLEQIYQAFPNQIVAVGECGLDYFFDNSPDPSPLSENMQKDSQKKLFQAQIYLAKKLKLPLIVHCRDDRSKNPENSECWDEILNMIEDHPTLLHCYSGLINTTERVLKMPNVLVSFAATITYPKNEYLRQAAKILPLEKIVLETDCPFLPPQSKRGQRNEPANIQEVSQLIADLKGLNEDAVAQTTSESAARLFAFQASSR